MGAIITVLAVLLIIAARLAWFQTGRIVDLRKKHDRAQEEIRALEDKLVRLECQNGLTPGVEP